MNIWEVMYVSCENETKWRNDRLCEVHNLSNYDIKKEVVSKSKNRKFYKHQILYLTDNRKLGSESVLSSAENQS